MKTKYLNLEEKQFVVVFLFKLEKVVHINAISTYNRPLQIMSTSPVAD